MTRIWFISLLALLLITQVCANISLVQKRDILIDRYLNKNDQPFTLEVNRRKKILETSRTIFEESPQAMNGQLLVKFEGDQATDNVDATMKEYFSLVSNDLLHPDYKLCYTIRRENHITYGDAISIDRFPNNAFHLTEFDPVTVHKDYINRLRHIGSVIGMAILNKQVMDITFDDRLYEMIIGRKIHDFNFDVKGPNEDLKYSNDRSTDVINENAGSTELSISDDKPITCRKFEMNYFPQAVQPGSTLSDRTGFTLTFNDKKIFRDAYLMLHELQEDNALFSMAVICQGIFKIIPQEAFTELKFNKQEIQTLISGETRELGIRDWERLISPDRTLTELLSIERQRMVIRWREPDTISDLNGKQWNGELEDVSWFMQMDYFTESFFQYEILSLITGISRLPVGLLDGIGHDQSKPYIKIEWSGEIDTLPTSDPYTNTLYLSSYTSKEKMIEHFKAMFDQKMCGAPVWFLSAAERR